MFSSYPRLIFKERRIVYSREELLFRVLEGKKAHKQILVSLYSFSQIRDGSPLDESAQIDILMYIGPIDKLKELSQLLLMNNIPSVLFFDGKEYSLLVEQDYSLEDFEELSDYPGTHLNKSVHKMIVWPGTINLETAIVIKREGQVSRIVEEFK